MEKYPEFTYQVELSEDEIERLGNLHDVLLKSDEIIPLSTFKTLERLSNPYPE